MEAFNWIATHTETDALFSSSYMDAGMWIPTFANRPSLGMHIHFIHEVSGTLKAMADSGRPMYYFITQEDEKEHKRILEDCRGKQLVFQNNACKIYH
jgi:hypothetical protein